MTSSFASDFELWLYEKKRLDELLRQKLVENFRSAWQPGSLEDRSHVLSFIFWTQEKSALEFVTSGLQDTNPEIATYAAAIAWSLISQDCDLGEDIENALGQFGIRFPEARTLSDAALEHLRKAKSSK
ncbi:MAG TPA: hypothetical protein VJB57_09740 [Dehalococcoidia bacterium]|nr:hypothetical protein [Dehalococcoidia bacterium]